MDFGTYSYTMTIGVFCGLALAMYGVGLLLRKRSAQLTVTDWKAIVFTIAVMAVVTGPEEHVALTWRTWSYNPEHTFDQIVFGAEIETFLFIVLVSLVVSIATIVYARREERRRAERGLTMN